MSTTIESLELEIQSSSTSAKSGIDTLKKSLEALKTATKGGIGLTSVAKQITAVNTAVNSINSSSISNLTGLVKAIQLLGGVKISSTIGGNITGIATAINGLKIDGNATTKLQELVTILQPLSNLPKQNLSSYINALKNIPKVLTDLNAVDMDAFRSKILEVTDAVKPLATEMEKVAAGFASLPTKTQKLLTSNQRLVASNKKIAFSFTDIYYMVNSVINVISSAGKIIYGFIKQSSDYIENMNLFTVAMGQYAGEAKDYAETVGEVMGIDPSEWMRNQGVFQTLATGFGVAGDKAAIMSKNLTQLGYDISSFYNIDVGDAMQKLKSGFAGELEPLRAIGYDLSQAKLEAVALSLGIDKSISSMTQAEKSMLRYYAIMTQVTTVQGDMARTLDDPANQIRILKAQISMLGREIGNIFLPAVKEILPYLIAATKVLRELASAIASFVGYEMPEMGDTGVESLASGSEETADALADASEEAKKLKSYMLGFDELNVISPTENSDSISTDAFDIDLPEYDFIGQAVTTQVDEIVAKMKEWLGITGELNSWSDLFDTRLGKILASVGLIGAGLVAWKVGTGVYSAISGIVGAISTLQTSLPALATSIGAIGAPVLVTIGVVTALVAGLSAVYATNEEVRESVNGVVKDIGEAFVPIFEFIANTVIPNCKAAWEELLEMLKPFGKWLSKVFTSIWMDMIVPALEYLSTTVIPALTETFENVWNNVIVPLAEYISSVFTPIIEILSEVLTWLWQYVIVPLANFVGGTFSKAWEGMAEIFNTTIIPIINLVIDVFQFLWDKVLSPIVTFLWDTFSPAFKLVFEGIGDTIAIIQGIFSNFIDFIVGVFTADWKRAMNGIIGVFEGLVNGIITGLNLLIKALNLISFDIPDWVPVIGGKKFGFNISTINTISLPRFAEGGFPESGQAFIARENGIPEMVGSIGRRTAVANNTQIVESVASGVAEANSEQNALLREQNTLLRALLEKDSGVYLDGRSLSDSVDKYKREKGRVLIAGGAL